MTYKFEYEDRDKQRHVRYYHALNIDTARSMFEITMDQLEGDGGVVEDIKILDVLKMEKGNWKHTEPSE
jgi:hypothetical protein